MENKKAIEIMLDQPSIVMPHNVMRFFVDGSRQIDFAGNQASLGEDFGDLSEIRVALDWLVDQFGGKVKWKRK